MLAASVEPRPVERREPALDRWAWFEGIPDPEVCGVDLRELSPEDVRLLGRSALRLWQAMERERGWAPQWFCLNLQALAERLRMSYRTAKRALARLRDCGAVETMTATKWWHPRELSGMGRWTTLSKYRVWGSWDLRRAQLRVVLPEQPFAAWAHGRIAHGGRRPKAGRPRNSRWPLISSKRDSGAPMARQKSSTSGGKVAPSLCTTTASGSFSTKKEPAAGAAAPAGGFTLPGIDPLTSPRPKLTPRQPPLKVLVADVVPKEPLHPISIDRRMDDKTRVEIIARGYRQAIQKHFGTRSASLKFGDVTKSKFYQCLKRAGAEFIEHGICPGAWADWFVGRDKERGMPRPPYLTVVFSPTKIKKWRGWFRKDYDGPKGWRPKFKPEHLEQMLRIREVRRLNRGFSVEGALSGLPKEYAEKRRVEIALGHLDPNDFWPKAA